MFQVDPGGQQKLGSGGTTQTALNRFRSSLSPAHELWGLSSVKSTVIAAAQHRCAPPHQFFKFYSSNISSSRTAFQTRKLYKKHFHDSWARWLNPNCTHFTFNCTRAYKIVFHQIFRYSSSTTSVCTKSSILQVLLLKHLVFSYGISNTKNVQETLPRFVPHFSVTPLSLKIWNQFNGLDWSLLVKHLVIKDITKKIWNVRNWVALLKPCSPCNSNENTFPRCDSVWITTIVSHCSSMWFPGSSSVWFSINKPSQRVSFIALCYMVLRGISLFRK